MNSLNITDKLLLGDNQFSCNYYTMQDYNRSFQNVKGLNIV